MRKTWLYCINWQWKILVYLLTFRVIQVTFLISDVSQIKVVFILRMFSLLITWGSDDGMHGVGKERREEDEYLLTIVCIFKQWWKYFQTSWEAELLLSALVSSSLLPSFSFMPIYGHIYIKTKIMLWGKGSREIWIKYLTKSGKV